MKEKAQVHMIPTEFATVNGILRSTHQPKELRIARREMHGNKIFDAGFEHSTQEWRPQHLYFTTDEEIKEGDWVIVAKKHLRRVTKIQGNQYLVTGESNCLFKEVCEKIIATTNPELWVAKIGVDFVKVYIETLMDKNPITEVLLEYERKFASDDSALDASYRDVIVLNNSKFVKVRPVIDTRYTEEYLLLALSNYGADVALAVSNKKTIPYYVDWFKKYSQ